jgi:ribosomal 30S subunit maturation factor RimM
VEVLVIQDDEGHEYLIPMAQSIVVRIDITRKRIQIDPPEGLLEL